VPMIIYLTARFWPARTEFVWASMHRAIRDRPMVEATFEGTAPP
jgi:hypothetical protein